LRLEGMTEGLVDWQALDLEWEILEEALIEEEGQADERKCKYVL